MGLRPQRHRHTRLKLPGRQLAAAGGTLTALALAIAGCGGSSGNNGNNGSNPNAGGTAIKGGTAVMAEPPSPPPNYIFPFQSSA